MLLSDTTARYEELNEGQLGGVVLADGRTVIANFGSKCGAAPTALQAVAAQWVQVRRGKAYSSASGYRAQLGHRFAHGLGEARLPAAPPEVPMNLARVFAAAGRDRHPFWRAAMATWPLATAMSPC